MLPPKSCRSIDPRPDPILNPFISFAVSVHSYIRSFFRRPAARGGVQQQVLGTMVLMRFRISACQRLDVVFMRRTLITAADGHCSVEEFRFFAGHQLPPRYCSDVHADSDCNTHAHARTHHGMSLDIPMQLSVFCCFIFACVHVMSVKRCRW